MSVENDKQYIMFSLLFMDKYIDYYIVDTQYKVLYYKSDNTNWVKADNSGYTIHPDGEPVKYLTEEELFLELL